MNGIHLNESDFDALLRQSPPLDKEKLQHLNGCPKCNQDFAQAKMIEAGLNSMPKPSLGIDLLSLVMPQLEKAQPDTNQLSIAIQSLIWCTIILFVAGCIYFKEYFTVFRIKWQDSVLPLLLLPIVFFMVWQIIDLIKYYYKTMNQLKFS